MSRVILVVEGQTEGAVVRDVIAPVLAGHEVFVVAALVGKPGHKGGIRPFRQVSKDIVRLLRQEADTRVGTFFDYYGLPADWPGVSAAKPQAGVGKARVVEAAMAAEVAAAMGPEFRRERFIPYIQLHELEGLLFVDPVRMAEAFERPDLAPHFAAIVTEFDGDCELINDGPLTAPSKRIHDAFGKYQKGQGLNAHAPLILAAIGVPRLCAACRHFGEWYAGLESSGHPGAAGG